MFLQTNIKVDFLADYEPVFYSGLSISTREEGEKREREGEDMLNAKSFLAKVWTNSNYTRATTAIKTIIILLPRIPCATGSLKHCVGRFLVSRCRRRHSGGETRPMPTLTRHRCALIRSRRRAAQRATDTNKHQRQPQINGCTE